MLLHTWTHQKMIYKRVWQGGWKKLQSQSENMISKGSMIVLCDDWMDHVSNSVKVEDHMKRVWQRESITRWNPKLTYISDLWVFSFQTTIITPTLKIHCHVAASKSTKEPTASFRKKRKVESEKLSRGPYST